MEAPRWEDLECGSLLGEGAFARVKHAKNVKTSQVFALKVVEKRLVQAQKRMEAVLNERNIHASLEHEGIIRLYCAWHDESAFYFALELVEGGELAAQISRMGKCTLGFTQFYAAEIVNILEYLRSRCIAHRDLKPENLLLTLKGHLKLIDFDAAVYVPDEGDGDAAGGQRQQLNPLCAGTSLYLAPEVVAGTVKVREAYALDLWALGCIVFLMLAGETPFEASPEYVLFERILNGEYHFPKDFNQRKAQHLIEALLSPIPGARPGMGPQGFAALKQHSFFGGSEEAFADLLECRPPPRLDRVARDLHMDIEWSEDSSEPFDIGSSAECTPEAGQFFLARHSEKIPVSGDKASAEDFLRLSFQSDYNGAGHSRSSMSPSYRRRSGSAVSQTSSVKWRSPRHSNKHSPRSMLSSGSTPSQACRWIQPGRPFMSWSQWINQLKVRQTLQEDEGVVICGSVVRRTFPCLRPKVLMLTDQPRLLLLDSSAVRLLNEIPLEGSNIVQKSDFDFELHAERKKRYYCYDCNGIQVWLKKIKAAFAHRQRQEWFQVGSSGSALVSDER
jgi:3-phosphoinositide dependent protein kinase-1